MTPAVPLIRLQTAPGTMAPEPGHQVRGLTLASCPPVSWSMRVRRRRRYIARVSGMARMVSIR